MDDTINILRQFVLTHSPSGYERQAQTLFAKAIYPFVNSVSLDVHGNITAFRKGKSDKSVMLMAHIDEIGFLIKYIDEKGYLYFSEIGGIDTNILPGLKLDICGDEGIVTGVVGKKPVHLQTKEERNQPLQVEDLWIDTGTGNEKGKNHKLRIGNYATYHKDFQYVEDTKEVIAPSLDDKIGTFVLLEVARQLKNVEDLPDIYFVSSVQEELGARGAQMITSSLHPDVGIAIDVTHATDYPGMQATKDGDIRLGGGVVIPVGPNMDYDLSNKIINTAKSSGASYQLEALSRPSGTDANYIQLSPTGVNTSLLSIPCRYMHTPNEIISMADVDNSVKLLKALLQKLY